MVGNLDWLALIEERFLKLFKRPFVYSLHCSGRNQAVFLGRGCEGCLVNNVPIAHLIEEKFVSLVEARKEGFARRSVCFEGDV